MPIENEFKYPLRISEELIERLGVEFISERLEQGYLSKENRIRRSTSCEVAVCTFTFKTMTKSGLVEIETEISEEDFERLWPLASNRLEKTRYAFDAEGVHWDVDFFGSLKAPYFAMAEAEVPEGHSQPEPCSWIADHVIACVGKDIRFTSRLLAYPAHAEAMLAELAGATAPALR